MPPTHLPFRRAAPILSRVRSAIICLSNSANDNRMLSVSRPSEPVVFSGCVTRYQADLAPLENLHQPREIQQRPAEPIHLIYQYAVDAIRLDVSEQFAECGPFQ